MGPAEATRVWPAIWIFRTGLNATWLVRGAPVKSVALYIIGVKLWHEPLDKPRLAMINAMAQRRRDAKTDAHCGLPGVERGRSFDFVGCPPSSPRSTGSRQAFDRIRAGKPSSPGEREQFSPTVIARLPPAPRHGQTSWRDERDT